MKTTTTIATTILSVMLCLSLAAAAQTVIDFNGLPRTGAPLPIPSGYAGMNWTNFDYVTELLTSGIQNVALPAFFGPGPGPGAEIMSSVEPNKPYRLLGMAVTGLPNTTLTLIAYNRGSFVGSKSYPLAPVLTPIRIPPEWGDTTQVTFVCRDAQGRSAIFNLFSLTRVKDVPILQ